MRTLQKTAKKEHRNRGYAVLELLFYLSFFSVLSLTVISAMLTMTASFKETALYAELVQSGAIMERITREIRGANDISAIGAGNLKLETKDYEGQNKTVEFVLSGTNIELRENGLLTGNLNAPGISVANLSFIQITSAQGKGIKVSVTLTSKNDKYGRQFDFYDTVVLRGDY